MSNNEQLFQVLNNHLKYTDEADVFWHTIITFIEKSMKNYVNELRDNGIDPSILGSLNRNNIDETVKDKLSQIENLLLSLSKLSKSINKTNSRDKERIEKLENLLQDKDLRLRENETLLKAREEKLLSYQDQLQSYKLDTNRKMELQPKKIKSGLNKELVLVRDRINMIHEMVVQAHEGSSLGSLQNNVNDAIQTIVVKLTEEDLWPETEKKPEPKTSVKKRNKKTKQKVNKNEQDHESNDKESNDENLNYESSGEPKNDNTLNSLEKLSKEDNEEL
ncbi:hypothetical protein [Halobacillus trueperi]|uniref:hypothetical protein n=1 Tax=Halobacillus trueperi TaxID=156205 RepID=UPI0037364000